MSYYGTLPFQAVDDDGKTFGGFPVASPGRRMASAAIDYVLPLALWIWSVTHSMSDDVRYGGSTDFEPVFEGFFPIWIVINSIVGPAIYGQSLGKLLVGTSVVTKSGRMV